MDKFWIVFIFFFVIIPIILVFSIWLVLKEMNKEMISKNKEVKILKYRLKHPRCRYCKYCKFKGRNFWTDSLYECIISKKTFIFNKNLISNLKGCFCDYFEPEAIDEI